MNNTTQQNEQVDPTALALSRSIRKAEGGNYDDSSGDASTSAGAYQWNNGKIPLQKGQIPANFQSDAKQYGLDPNDFSQTNQDHVAYSKVKDKLDKGQSQSSIAAEWNSGLSSGWENHVGDTTINGKTIHYDTPGYVATVQKYYEEEMNNPSQNGSTQDTNPASTNYTSFSDQLKDLPQSTQTSSPQEESISGDLQKGNIGGALMKGVNDITSPFAGLAAIPVQAGVKAYNKITGSSIPDPYSPEGGNTSSLGVTPLTAKDKGSDLLKAGATTAGVAGAGLVGSALGGSSVLKAPEIGYNIPMTMEKFAGLSRIEKLNTLGEALKTAETGDSEVIAKAIKYLKPSSSWVSKIVQGGIKEATKFALYNALGNKVGGIVHGLIHE